MKTLKQFAGTLIISVLFVLFAGCESEKRNEGNMHNNGDEMHENGNEMHENGDGVRHNNGSGAELLDSTVIRDTGTDIASLDENGDGILYQCPMHFEVISDTGGRCPECKMYLEEYSSAEAGQNFIGKKE